MQRFDRTTPVGSDILSKLSCPLRGNRSDDDFCIWASSTYRSDGYVECKSLARAGLADSVN